MKYYLRIHKIYQSNLQNTGFLLINFWRYVDLMALVILRKKIMD